MKEIRSLNYYFNNRIKKDLIEKLDYIKTKDIPNIENIFVNISLKNAVNNKKNLVPVLLTLELITGQIPIITKAKTSIATYKLKKGMPIGCKVKLNGYKSYLFLLKLVISTLPHIKEFIGFNSCNFDGSGNFAFGINNFTSFSEISLIYDKFDLNFGMDIVITTTAKTNQEAKIFLSGYNLPFIN